MRQTESDYWDSVARKRNVRGLKDNVWKRCEIVSRILRERPYQTRILEIGVGQGMAAAITHMACIGHLEYVGTDVSAEFCRFVTESWHLKTVQTDIRKLPDGPFDMVWAFDTLEHVRPEDRAQGWAEISRVLASPGLILINNPLDDSHHDEGFDWGLDMGDVANLAAAVDGTVTVCDAYTLPELGLSYQWIEIMRR